MRTCDCHAAQLKAQTIFQLLDSHGISWKIYYAHVNPDGTPSTTFSYFGYSSKYIYRVNNHLVIDGTHIAPISQYFQDGWGSFADVRKGGLCDLSSR